MLLCDNADSYYRDYHQNYYGSHPWLTLGMLYY